MPFDGLCLVNVMITSLSEQGSEKFVFFFHWVLTDACKLDAMPPTFLNSQLS